MSDIDLRKLITTSSNKSLGRCLQCHVGDVILHKSGNFYVCTQRLANGPCDFTLNRYRLENNGKRSISEKGMRRLLNKEVLIFDDFLDTRTGEPLNHPCRIFLGWVPAINKVGLVVDILWHESV
jgi:hypothetical protein